MSQLSVTSLKHEGASGDNITLSSNGNVGVGSTAPSTNKLHIESAGATRAVVYNSSNAVGVRIQAETGSGLIQTDTNHPLRFATNNGAVQMQIDTAGRVTMPYQPAFCGILVADASGVLVMTDMTLNNGSHYSTSNGKFTAPVAGMYHFILITLEQGSTGAVYIRKNGSNVGNHGWMGSTNAAGVVSAIVSLAVGDYVEAYGTVTCERNNTGFCGFLVG